MLMDWTKNLKEQAEKEEFENYLRSCKRVFTRLEQLLDERKASLDRSETDIKSFDLPNWDHRQAYKNGFRACLDVVQKLIDLDKRTQEKE